MTALLRELPGSTAAMLAVFDDAATLRAALDFEAALAQAQAAEHLIPPAAAQLIVATCTTARFETMELASEVAHAGTLAIPLVRRLKALVSAQDPIAATFVHRGSTSQDLADSVLMQQVKRAEQLLREQTGALCEALAELASRHAHTVALGRTLLQPALPITLGLRAVQWLLGIDAADRRLRRECEGAIRLQLGGAVGTLAELTMMVVERVGAQLGLPLAPLPWHARREGIAGLGTALAILIGTAGKIARDVSLLSQAEIAEAFEPRIPGRGGSSSVTHKRNPTGCQVALSAAIRAPGLAAAVLAGLPQEQERGLGGWQAEGPVLAELFALAHGALSAMHAVIAGLEVDAAALQRNLHEAGVGEDAGLAPQLVEQALRAYRERP